MNTIRKNHRLVLLAVVLIVGAGALPARASNFSGANGQRGCYVNAADNRVHSIWYQQLSATAKGAVNWSRSRNYDPTAVDTVTEDARDRMTDVIVMDADYEGAICGRTWLSKPAGSGVIGIAMCRSLSGRRCNQFSLLFDNDFMGPQPAANENALACHELGHSLGVAHASQGCMASGGGSATFLREHDRRHLNTYYTS